MAVAPDSSFTKRVTNLDMLDLLGFASRLLRDQALFGLLAPEHDATLTRGA
jgi:hypothetical protein